MAKTGTKKVNISAVTGRYVKHSEVKRHPKTTITMTVKTSKPAKKSK